MIRAAGLSFTFGGRPLFDGLDLDVAPGETLCLVGRTGTGKSTLLRLLAGLLPPTAGTVQVPDRLSLVFQDPRLLPWMTVAENLSFALEAKGVPPRERPARVARAIARVGLEAASDLRPAALSGGMAQRAALARGLVVEPDALLLDEPFAAVDPLTREALQVELRRLIDDSGITAVLVTHDVREALLLGDRVGVLRGSPARLSFPGTDEASIRAAL